MFFWIKMCFLKIVPNCITPATQRNVQIFIPIAYKKNYFIIKKLF
jgi:hypothetical protein